MNTVREISRLNALELEKCVPPEASWHTDYRDTAYIHIGSLPFTISEGDILTIFSQYGTPTFLHLVRDKETGKSKGFGWLKYEDQRSCDLAVDNLGGAEVLGRTIRVDHARYERKELEGGGEAGVDVRELDRQEAGQNEEDEESEGEERVLLKEELELRKMIAEHDEDDPMKGFLIEEKKAEVAEALKRAEKEKRKKDKGRSHRHRSDRRNEYRGERKAVENGRRHDSGGRVESRRHRSRSQERRKASPDRRDRERSRRYDRDSSDEDRSGGRYWHDRHDGDVDGRRDRRQDRRRRSGSP